VRSKFYTLLKYDFKLIEGYQRGSHATSRQCDFVALFVDLVHYSMQISAASHRGPQSTVRRAEIYTQISHVTNQSRGDHTEI